MRRKQIYLDPSFRVCIVNYPDGSGVVGLIDPQDQDEDATYVVWQTFVPGDRYGSYREDTMAKRLCKNDLDHFSQQWRAMGNMHIEDIETGQN